MTINNYGKIDINNTQVIAKKTVVPSKQKTTITTMIMIDPLLG
jgi:hypothetical protein